MSISRRQFNQLLLLAGASVALPGAVYAEDATPVAGGTLNFVSNNEITQLVAINTTSGGPRTFGSKIFEGLLTYDYDLKPYPALATAWSVSDDGLSYEFKLRDGVKWSDGKPLTSEDVAFSIGRLKEAHPRGRVSFANVTDIDSSDPAVVRLSLSKPTPLLLTALAVAESPIIPKHIFAAIDPTGDPKPEQIIGSGPFVLGEWVAGSHLILERNPTYWDAPKPYIDRIIVRTISDAGARAAAFETGEIDIGSSPVPLADLGRFQTLPNVVVDTTDYAYSGSLHQLIFNLDNPTLQHQQVRLAVAHAINVDALVALVYSGFATVSPTPISVVNTRYFNPAIKPHAFDVDKANALLDEAGFPRGADGNRFSVRLTQNPNNPPLYGDFLRQSLAAIGIDARIEKFDFAGYTKTVYTDRTWDLTAEFLSNSFDPTAGVQRGYWSKNFKIGLPFSNGAHYENLEVDALLEAAAIEPNEDRRRELFFRFQEIIDAELPIINLAAPNSIVVANNRVRNYAPGAEGLDGTFADAWLDPNA
ncbi:MAG: ABC-type dipeptide transport system, periplasmic component [Devosia sp.]|nr:ABC-type dipeptide transport system, periplasmic component [Devosia sp.]